MFEEAVRSYTGAGYARATTSCTTALHLALVACGVGPEDEVILPSFTFVASANAVEYVGARPVFIDIDLKTFNIDVSRIESAITHRTKAIMPVHLFGLCADMGPVLKIAAKHNLRIVEDAACAIGGFYNGKHAGTMGEVGCFSFHPRKSITTGEGGMVLTDDPELAHQVEILHDHGAEISDLARHEGKGLLLPQYNTLGYNYRMTDFQGALGVTQMQKLSYILEQKRRLAARYTEALSSPGWLQPPIVPDGYVHGYQAYVCALASDSRDGITPDQMGKLRSKRDKLMAYLGQQGISTRQGTHAVHALGFYREKYGIGLWDFPNAWIAENISIALPLYPQMTDGELDFVCDMLRKGAGA
jgi:dTDP-4-amino-4,6-dideoxygalactose transaminase